MATERWRLMQCSMMAQRGALSLLKWCNSSTSSGIQRLYPCRLCTKALSNSMAHQSPWRYHHHYGHMRGTRYPTPSPQRDWLSLNTLIQLPCCQQKYKHLRELPQPPVNRTQPLLLIGSDMPHLITPVQPVHAGPPGRPVAICTKLVTSRAS